MVNSNTTYREVETVVNQTAVSIRNWPGITQGYHDECSADARTFFEKLWRYDQVVFDTSNSVSPS